MSIKITKDTPMRLEFILSNTEIGFANLLRRTMISSIPILAIDYITISHNTSYKSETLAHSIGLIPIISKLKLPLQCSSCESFCNKCSCKLQIDIKNEENDILKVYSNSFTAEENKDVKLLPKMPIIKLKKGEYIKVEAYVKMGLGKKHAKWQPVSVAGYNYTKPQATKFNFYVQTTGSFTNKEILKKALEIIRDQAKNLLLKI